MMEAYGGLLLIALSIGMKVYQVYQRLCTSAELIKANTDYCDVSVVCVPNYRNGIGQESFFLQKKAEKAGKRDLFSRGWDE